VFILYYADPQDNLDKSLLEEQQKNAGQLAEIEDLQKLYDEKVAAFAVSHHSKLS